MKKGQFSKFVVGLVITLNILYTFTVLAIFLKTAVEPTTLTVSWFAFTTGELWMLSGIKKKKLKNNDTEG